MIVNTKTLEGISEGELRSLFKDTSFPVTLTTACLSDFGFCIVDEPDLPVLGRFERASLGAPYLDGETIKVDWIVTEEVPPVSGLMAEFEAAIDAMLNAKAREMRYDSVYTMISYRGDPNPRFDLEARSMFAWRSAVWTQANLMMEAFTQEQGAGEIPTPEQVIAQLPAFSLLEAASS